jgi:hypothetical protein
MSKIFISHATEEEDLRMAKELAAQLEALGQQTIYDPAKLHPGRDASDARIRELADSDAVVVLLTKHCLPEHCSRILMAEIGMALAFQHTFGKMLLLTVYVGIDIKHIPGVVQRKYHLQMDRTSDSIRGVAKEIDEAVRNEHVYPKIFISHRHSDKQVAQALVDLLEAAFQIKPHDVRCTSIHKYALNIGDRTTERLRTELRHAKVVLGIISPDVKDSSYVMFELGASWGRSGITLPLLIRGATVADVPAPIGDLHAVSLTDADACDKLLKDLTPVVSLTPRIGQDEAIASRILDLTNAARA